MKVKTRWTRESAIKAFREFYEKNGYRPGVRSLRDYKQLPQMDEIKELFGSYENFLKAAGLPPLHPEREDLIEAVRRGKKYLGRVPTTADVGLGLLTYSMSAFRREFANWPEALEVADCVRVPASNADKTKEIA